MNTTNKGFTLNREKTEQARMLLQISYNVLEYTNKQQMEKADLEAGMKTLGSMVACKKIMDEMDKYLGDEKNLEKN